MRGYEVKSNPDPTSKWHIAANSFETFQDAMRYSISIAKRWDSERDAPGISITGPDCDSEPWSVKGLLQISALAEMPESALRDWTRKRFLRGKKKLDDV